MRYNTAKPIVPILLHDPQMPPVVPSCSLEGIPQEILQYSGQIAVTIINDAGSKAHGNAARMYCYNALSDNGYSNPLFQEAFDLTVGIIGLNVKKQPYSTMNVLQHLRGAVEQSLTLLTGALLFREPELKSLVAPRLIDAASQNVPVLNDLQQEIHSMFANTPMQPGYQTNTGMSVNVGVMNGPQGPVLAVQFASNNTQYFPIGNFNGQPFVSINNQQYPISPTQQGVMMMVNNNWMPAAAIFSQMMQSQMQQQYQQQSMYPQQSMPGNFGMGGGMPNVQQSDRYSGGTFAKPQAGGNPLDQGQFIDHRYNDLPAIETKPVQQVKQVVQQQVVQLDETTEAEGFKTLKLKGEVMGSSEIHILGNTFSLNGVVRQQEVRDALSTMGTIINGVDDDCDVIHPNQIYAVDIEEAIRSGKIEQLSRANSNNALYRTFGYAINPIITKHKVLTQFINKLRKSMTVTEIANRLRSMGEALNSPEYEKKEASEIAVILAAIDRYLTDLANNYLSINMYNGSKEIVISSFTEDIADLPKYLLRTRGQNFASAFNAFEKTVVESLNAVVSSAEDSLIESLDLPDELSAICIPLGFSITYTCLTRNEFGFELKKDPVIIDRQVAPELYKICETLGRHKRSMDAYTLNDYLITSDGERYRLYENAISDDMYLIEKL